MPTEAYLDWNATAKLRPEAQAAVTAALDVTGNPSSVHGAGRAARRLVEDARDKVAALVHAAGGLVHVDAVQGPGRIACDFKALGADLMTLSSHKIGGPQGVGALVRRDGLALDPQIRGGGQERGARAGTENAAGIAGFGAAAEAARQGWIAEAARMAALRDRLEAGIKAVAPKAVIFGGAGARAPNTTLC